jgi:hypothetical protein
MDRLAYHYLERHKRKVYKRMQKLNKHRKSLIERIRGWKLWTQI